MVLIISRTLEWSCELVWVGRVQEVPHFERGLIAILMNTLLSPNDHCKLLAGQFFSSSDPAILCTDNVKIISKAQWWRWCKYKRGIDGGELLSILVEAKFPAPFYSLICSSSNIVLLFNFCLHVFAFVFFYLGGHPSKKGPKLLRFYIHSNSHQGRTMQ